ncbi:hypothetical protein [Streptomyces sp. NPDC088748]|uniref:hypothetical protein n=1 Tax=Streptomyces sp. NPDC088748 TaxID=3365887 RepID=UPI0037FF4A79
MGSRLHRGLAVGVVLAWASVACAAGGDEASMDRTALVGTWTSETGARLTLGADRRVTGTDLRKALLGGSTCTDSASGEWSFYTAPDKAGSTHVDDSLTSGQQIAIGGDGMIGNCLLSAVVRKDERGFNLCLVVDPDSACSGKELLRRDQESARSE